MITVTGEALFDLVIGPDGRIAAQPGGGPFNTAPTMGRLSRILRRTDVVKVSVEDLGYLSPGEPVPAAASVLLDQGPATVLVTDGSRQARAFLPGQEVSVDVPVVKVVDNIGAGDAFGGAFLAWWSGNELTRSDLHRAGPVREALRAAVEVAALTCTRIGAEPPWRAEVRARPGWRGYGDEA